MRKRWRLRAVARNEHEATVFAEALARAWNDKPQTFRLRISARRAANFYEKVLGIPAHFYVVPNCQPLEHSYSEVGDDD